MNWVTGFARVTCLAMPLAAIAATTVSAMPVAGPVTVAPVVTKVAMTDDEKRAKAADCSAQANTKKLHGEARRKFRASCKKM